MKTTKGIILAGGLGTRLYPITIGNSKQLLPVYDKPMIYNSISVMINSGIKKILIITSPEYIKNYTDLIGDGSSFGLSVFYEIQDTPRGIADAFIIGKKFIGVDNVCLILGDNIFFGDNFSSFLEKAIKNLQIGYSTILAKKVNNPENFGVVEFNKKNNFKIIEKPKKFLSNWIVSGLYFYTNDVIKYASKLKPSKRNELEITDLNNIYIEMNRLKILKLNNKIYWSDTGTKQSLIETSLFFYNYEKKYNKKINCIEVDALNKGLINKNQFYRLLKRVEGSDYGKYLSKIYENNYNKV